MEPGAGRAIPASSLSATLLPEKSQILLGEPVHIVYRLINSGDGDLQFREGGNQRNRLGRHDDYQIVVTNDAGEELPVLDSSPSFGGISWAPKLSADGGRFEHQLFLPHWTELSSVGTYTIRSERIFTLRAAGSDPWHGESGDEILVKAETQIEVVPASATAMGDIIKELGEELFSAKESSDRTQAWQKTTAINDERVIPWFCKAIDTGKYNFVSSALSGLEKFKSDQALSCIKKAVHLRGPDLTDEFTKPELAESSANNLRQHVAHTLSASPHPDAFALLLTMSNDPYDSVRLSVLHEIAKRKPKDVRQRISDLTKDPSEMVRKEATRYLSEL